MKYSLISDMHLDHPQKKTPYELLEKNVVVAGDTANGLLGLKFLQKLRNKGFNVFAVDGNHEHYSNVAKGRTIEDTTNRFRQDNPNVADFEGVPIIGVNGWYQVSNGDIWYSYMNDGPNAIGGLPSMAGSIISEAAFKDFSFLKEQLETIPDKCVVVTHTAPCVETLDPRFEGHYSNEWYYNGLMYELLEEYQDKILIWNHGHTHSFSDTEVKGVRIVCNPRGYPRENPNWKPFTIEL